MKKIITSIIIAMTMVASSFALDFSIGAKGGAFYKFRSRIKSFF